MITHIFGSWAEHTASWWSYRDRKNVLLLTYGEMKKSPEEMIGRIAEWMGVDLTREQLEKVVEKSSFLYMKTHEDNFVPPLSLGGKTIRLGTLIRKGNAGNSKELIDREKQAAIDRFCLMELKRLGSDFPYADEFLSNSM